MKKNTYLNRHLREGFNNFIRNGWMTVSSVSSLSLMLFLVGVTSLLLLNLNYMVAKVEENVEIHVYLKNANSKEIKILSNTIQSFEHVSTVTFISKNKGLKSFMKNLGDEGAAFQTLKRDNPLNDELVVKTKQPLDVMTVAKRINQLALVDKVSYAKNVVGPLVTTTKLARIVGITFIICLTFIAVHAVTNTIKITVMARKEEIQLRKLIGATNNFIRLPFFIEGSSIGLIGAAIASLFVGIGYYFAYSYFNKFIDIEFIKLLSPLQLIPISCLLLLIFGSLIGIWGAISSLRRMLKV
ncbi:permease-like cell division protein FtsX [Neobacillus sp. PS3-12]|uniref:permease-like cell division protein FtsX n=1 Tax=Neobacillus sp. PS3-12 TaxID=3070677 RepID=UPI0027E20D78|nr:permease-like cell division protein FtsX [Neobacillus sp. PS3-12]WML52906.1 permease-like cell division protein FtsX [Neobacillus sp. PS3-12]